MPHKRNTKNDCQHIDAAGRHCRMPRAKHHDTYCLPHAKQQQQQKDRATSEAIADELLDANKDFDSAIAIHATLGNLFTLTAQDRISTRKATSLVYIAQLLVGTLPLMKDESSMIDAHIQFKHLAQLRKAAETAAAKAAAKAAAETFRQTPHAPSAKDDGRSSQDGHTAAAEAPKSAPPDAAAPRPWPIPMTNTRSYST